MPTKIVFTTGQQMILAQEPAEVVAALRGEGGLTEFQLDEESNRRVYVNVEQIVYIEESSDAAERSSPTPRERERLDRQRRRR